MAVRRGVTVPVAQGQMTGALAVMLAPKTAPRKPRAKRATTKRRKTTAKRAAAPKRRTKTTGRLKKGSAAAKRRMAQLRKMRKR